MIFISESASKVCEIVIYLGNPGLVDEVEQHLHPIWQKNVLNLLQSTFPNIQFIVTTHSPLVITGSKSRSVYALDRPEISGVKIYGWRAEDVYRDILGMEYSRPDNVVKDLKKFRELNLEILENRASNKRKKEYDELYDRLRMTLHGADPALTIMRLRNLKSSLNKNEP